MDENDKLVAEIIYSNLRRRFKLIEELVDEGDKNQMQTDVMYSELYVIVLNVLHMYEQDLRANMNVNEGISRCIYEILNQYDSGTNDDAWTRHKLFEYEYSRGIDLF